MPYTAPAHSPFSAGSTCDNADLNAMNTGITGAYTQLESITANDAITAPSSDGPKTLATFISEYGRQLRLIVGGADWYTAPATSLSSLNTNKISKASGSGFANSDIGVGDIAHRPAAGNKGRLYVETPFS
jgi:hypothetical protein